MDGINAVEEDDTGALCDALQCIEQSISAMKECMAQLHGNS